MDESGPPPTVRKLLVLDLDETLIHASEQALDREPDFRVGPYFVYRRPHLREFIEHVSQHFDLAVWTASGETYAQLVTQQIFPEGLLRFVWASRRCTMAYDPRTCEYMTLKDLRKLKRLGFALSTIVAVDDTPSKFRRSYGNLVHVREFVGDVADTELRWLAEYLPTLAHVPSVRTVEKRGWRQVLEKRTAAE